MLFEYALEPTILSSWPTFQQLVSQFGVEHGRLISRYPSKWKKMVYEALGSCTTIEKHRITESLTRIDYRLLVRQCQWVNGNSWLQNAEQEHASRPFHAIIADDNPRSNSSVLVHASLDPTAPPPLWDVPRSQIIERTAQKMADVLAPLLSIASRVVLVDPHFGAENRRHRVVLETIIATLAQNLRGRVWPEIRYITGNKADASFFRETCLRELPRRLATGSAVVFVSVNSADIHNRYVLTDRGGVQLGDGLDECEAGAGRTDCFTLLARSVAMQLLAEYWDNSKLRISQSVQVDGEAPI
jgi:hypothetical protein